MDIVFTPAAVLDMLNQIDELKEYDLGINETIDGKLQLTVGGSIYEIDPNLAAEVEVPEETAETIQEINEEAYEELVDDAGFEKEDQEEVEAGFIKEAIKSMLLGGAITIIKKLL